MGVSRGSGLCTWRRCFLVQEGSRADVPGLSGEGAHLKWRRAAPAMSSLCTRLRDRQGVGVSWGREIVLQLKFGPSQSVHMHLWPSSSSFAAGPQVPNLRAWAGDPMRMEMPWGLSVPGRRVQSMGTAGTALLSARPAAASSHRVRRLPFPG